MDINDNNKISVSRLLEFSFANDFKVLAGEKSLNNVVSGGNIMDNPKALDWFSPGEVLITSGYFLTNDINTQKEALSNIKKANVSAVFIKALTFYEEIPKSIIDYCNQISLPLVEIPYGVAFAGILNAITNAISSHIDEEKQLALDSHNRFFRSALNGGGVNVITKDLGLLLNATTIVVDYNWTILAYDNINEDQIKHFTINDENMQFNLDALEDLPIKVDTIKHIIYRSYTINNNSIRCAIAPIYFNTVNYGYIIVISVFDDLTSMDHVVIESASMALALQISQQIEADRNSNRVIRDFFKQLISGNMIDANLLKNVGIDIDYNGQYSFIILNVDINKDEDTSIMKLKQKEISSMQKVLDDIRQFSKFSNVNLQAFKQGNKIFGLYKKISSESDEHNRLIEEKFFNDLLLFIQQQQDSKVHISIMIGSAQSVINLKISYEEALRIDSFAVGRLQNIFFYDDFYLELFLSEHISETSEKEFYNYFLKPLIKYDETNSSELTKTLEEYLNNQFNVADTARKLFIHRNTMLYRLNKIEEILKTPINSPKLILSLQLAFEFYNRR